MLRRRSRDSLLEAAIGYAGRGVPVFPCHAPVRPADPDRWAAPRCSCQQLTCMHPGQHPLSPQWREEATTDPARIRSWWARHPDANVGLVTGVVFDVLDVDGDAGSRLERSRAPLGPVARTASGRWHFFVAPSGMGDTVVPGRSGSRLGASRARIHCHGRGGYVMAAPSRHPSGNLTEWVRPLAAPLPEMAPLLGELLAATGASGGFPPR